MKELQFGRLISKEAINYLREGLKNTLETMRQNYLPGYTIAPKGTLENYNVFMKVNQEDIDNFTLGLSMLDTIEKIVSKNYTTEDILHLLDAENKLNTYLYSTRYEYLPIGIEIPDCCFLKAVHLMCQKIKVKI